VEKSARVFANFEDADVRSDAPLTLEEPLNIVTELRDRGRPEQILARVTAHYGGKVQARRY